MKHVDAPLADGAGVLELLGQGLRLQLAALLGNEGGGDLLHQGAGLALGVEQRLAVFFAGEVRRIGIARDDVLASLLAGHQGKGV